MTITPTPLTDAELLRAHQVCLMIGEAAFAQFGQNKITAFALVLAGEAAAGAIADMAAKHRAAIARGTASDNKQA